MDITADTVIDRAFKLGENPLWDDRAGLLCFTDIDAGELWEYDPATGDSRCFYQGPKVGGFTYQDDGSMLLFRVDDVVILSDRDQGVDLTPVLDVSGDTGMERFNDVIATPHGDVLAGTIGASDETGGLYRLTSDGSGDGRWSKLFAGTRISNGMAFSDDHNTFFWTCSTTRRIFRFELENGIPVNRELFLRVEDESEGTPDGMTIDAEGMVFSARWGASRVLRHDAMGHTIGTIHIPVERASSVCFGGPDLATLFITSSEGGLYVCRPGVGGRPEFRSRIQPPGVGAKP